jgi:hypothetical protein
VEEVSWVIEYSNIFPVVYEKKRRDEERKLGNKLPHKFFSCFFIE